MPAGIEIWNNHGSVLLDENFHNLCLKEKGTGTTNQPTGVTLSSTALFAVHTNTEIHVPFGGNCSSLIGSGASTFTWYVFDKPVSSASTYGLQVFHPTTGELIFDALRKQMRVAGQVSIGLNYSAIPYRYVAGRKYAMVVGRSSRYERIDNLGPDPVSGRTRYHITRASATVKCVSGGLDMSYKNTFDEVIDFGSPVQGFSDSRLQGLVIDVTGY